MNLTLDTDLSQLVQSAGFTSALEQILANRGDGEHLHLMLTRLGVPWQAPAGAELRFIVKGGPDADAFADDAEALALADEFTWDATRQLYTADINYRTTPLDDLFTDGVKSITAKAQVAMRLGPTAKWKRSQPVEIILTKELYTGLDGSPEDTPVSDNYPTKPEVIRYFAAVVGMTGGGDTKLDGLLTPELPLNTAVAFVDAASSNTLRIYELVAGTDAESAPAVIRPDDYAGGTNERVWKLRYAATDVSALGDTIALKANTIQYQPTMVGLTGGGSTKLDGLVTTTLSADITVALIDDGASNALRVYELVAGVDAEASPDIIRPDDFNSVTNAKVWKLRNPAAPGLSITTPQVYYIEKTVGNDGTAQVGNPAKPYLTEQAAFDAAVTAAVAAELRFGVGYWEVGILRAGNWPTNIMLTGAGRSLSRLAAVVCSAAAATNGTDHGTTPTDGGAGQTGRTMDLHSDGSLRIDDITSIGGHGGEAGEFTAPAASETTGTTGKDGGDGGNGGTITLTEVAYINVRANGGVGADGGKGQQGGSATGVADAGDGGSGGEGGAGGAPGTIKMIRCHAMDEGEVEALPGVGGAAGDGGDPGVNSADSELNGDAGTAGSAGSAGAAGEGTSRIELSRIDAVEISGTLRLDNSLYVAATATTLTNNNSTQIASL